MSFRSSLLPGLLLVALLAGCSRDKAAPAGTDAGAGETQSTAAVSAPFKLEKAESESFDGRPGLALKFSQKLASTQNFDALLQTTEVDGGAVKGSWSLDESGRVLRFPFVEPNQKYRVIAKAGLASAQGKPLEGFDHVIDVGDVQSLVGFASQGSILPTHESRGIPVISINVPEVDVEFFRVRDGQLAQFVDEYASNGERGYWQLEELPKWAESVYTNRFVIDTPRNERGVSHLPVRDIPELAKAGVYFAVMKQAGRFDGSFETSMFMVSDIGLHVRAYADSMLLHAASLKTGRPQGGVTLELRLAAGRIERATTDVHGLARFAHKVGDAKLLSATQGSDFSMLSFTQPALDLSEFPIDGRRHTDIDVFAWSSRDLFRPGESLRVSALMRDGDGASVRPQSLFATLRQPDGRLRSTRRLDPEALGYFEFVETVALDAPTGRWRLELSPDPGKPEKGQSFAFRVEEFLPERLKLNLDSDTAPLAAKMPLKIEVQADYLYGAPAGGNRFVAKLVAVPDQHAIDVHRDFYFGDALMQLPKDPVELFDGKLDTSGHAGLETIPLQDTPLTGPVALAVTGSVFESGGRAVNRVLKRSVWPATELIGIRPRFDLDDGSPANGKASFEVIRSNVAGELLEAKDLVVRLIRERRDWHWTHVEGSGWRSDYTARFEQASEQKLSFAAGGRGQLDLPVEWGGYRIEVVDPATRLVTRLPFNAGWGWDNQNIGAEARPDKVKLALDRVSYVAEQTARVTITPPHAGSALLLLEGDHLLWSRTLQVKAGAVVDIPIKPEWQRHDLYLTAIVFRPGSSVDRVTPNRSVGIVHVPLARSDRRVAVGIRAAATMRPQRNMQVSVAAPALAGHTAQMRVVAADLGVVNLTRYPVPDAADWFFGRRGLATQAYDLYGRVIESLDGRQARLRFGGDAALPALPQGRRPNTELRTVDLFNAPVKLDARGAATVKLAVPDFNGTLRVSALVFAADRFGSAATETIVRAPLVAEASLPRVLAMGDRSRFTLDLTNLSGADARYRVRVRAEGPVAVDGSEKVVALKEGERTTLGYALRANGSFGVGVLHVEATGPGVDLDRVYRIAIRPPWPNVRRSAVRVLEEAAPISVDPSLLSGFVPDSVTARISVGTLPPLPFTAALEGLIDYPYGCAEQTSSRAYPLIWLDEKAATRFGLPARDMEVRRAQLADAFGRLSAMQNGSGHFSFWPGESEAAPWLTPYIVELMLNARDAGFAIPEPVLVKALDRILGDLLGGGRPHYEAAESAAHLRVAEMAYGAYVLARVQRAPLGTLRAIFDNERGKLKSGLPLVHLGIALSLQGDRERGAKALEEAFKAPRRAESVWLGDYGSPLRDTALMIALTHQHKLGRPAFDASAIELARDLAGGRGSSGKLYLSTQEQTALFRLGLALASERAPINAVITGAEGPGAVVASSLITATARAGNAGALRVVPEGSGPLYASIDTAGVPARFEPTSSAAMSIKREWFRTDGKPYDGKALHEGEALLVRLTLDSAQRIRDGLVTDLLPGGLEAENLNLVDPAQWQEVEIEGTSVADALASGDVRYSEYRDDRFVAAVELWPGSTKQLVYLVRAVSPGVFVNPPPMFEDMYRPELRAVGSVASATIEIVPP